MIVIAIIIVIIVVAIELVAVAVIGDAVIAALSISIADIDNIIQCRKRLIHRRANRRTSRQQNIQ